jgi:hypothetical protein
MAGSALGFSTVDDLLEDDLPREIPVDLRQTWGATPEVIPQAALKVFVGGNGVLQYLMRSGQFPADLLEKGLKLVIGQPGVIASPSQFGQILHAPVERLYHRFVVEEVPGVPA